MYCFEFSLTFLNGFNFYKSTFSRVVSKIGTKLLPPFGLCIGMDKMVDSYSAFMDNDRKTKSALEGVLRENGVTDIYCVGLAYDYCVGYTALDGISLGFKSFVIKDCTASITRSDIEESSVTEREAEFFEQNVKILYLKDFRSLAG